MRVLITGAGGYIGSLLTWHLLSKDHDVTAVDTTLAALAPFVGDVRLTLIHADANSEELLRLVPEHDAIVPLAAIVGAKACEEQPELAEKTNLEAVTRLNEARGDRRVVFVTTDSGYRSDPGGRVDEDSPFEPVSLYARTKHAAEQALLAQGNATSFRLGSVYGVSYRMRHDLLLHFLVRHAVLGVPKPLTDAPITRSFVHVNDVVAKIGYALSSPYPTPSNVAAESTTKRDLATLIENEVPGYKFLADVEGADSDKRDFVLGTKHYAYFKHVGLRAGIQELIRYYDTY